MFHRSRTAATRLTRSANAGCPSASVMRFPHLEQHSAKRRSSSFQRGHYTPPPAVAAGPALGALQAQRGLSGSAVRRKGQVKPFVLADIGEGITECEIVKW